MSDFQINTHKISSLKKRAGFLRVQKEGKKWISKSFILQICPNDNEGQRFGLVVTKRLYKLAVDRNRVKRRLREAISEILPSKALNNYDYVFIARRDTISKPYKDLQKDMLWCLGKLEAIERVDDIT
ncbi:MAG: ribonuclease P protein component [Micavibrio sp.]|nr:ribonuclease P protein component [Micavibrio sp.]